MVTAVLSGAERGGADTVRNAAGGAAPGVAGDRLRRFNGMLVRAREQDNLPAHLQEPQDLGLPLQILHPKPVNFILFFQIKLPFTISSSSSLSFNSSRTYHTCNY